MLYTARVVDNIDFENLGKIRVTIPKKTGSTEVQDAVWAEACLPSRSFSLPAIGEYVWVMCESGTHVWLGWAPVNCVENYTQGISERNDCGAKKKHVKPFISSVPFTVISKPSSVISTPDRHTLMKTPGGITFFADDNLANDRYSEIDPDDLEALSTAMLSPVGTTDTYHWGIEDPHGNYIVTEHFEDDTTMFHIVTRGDKAPKKFQISYRDDTKQFAIKTTDFEFSHDALAKTMTLQDVNKNSIKMSDKKVILDSTAGTGDLLVKTVNGDGEEPLILGNTFKKFLDEFMDVFTKWIPVPMDGGSALKAALTPVVAKYTALKYITKA